MSNFTWNKVKDTLNLASSWRIGSNPINLYSTEYRMSSLKNGGFEAGISHRKLATMFNVIHGTIGAITRCENWRHIE